MSADSSKMRSLPRVTLYTKPGCGLCDEAKDVIAAVAETHRLELVCRNILEDLADYERYKHEIPVVFINDVEVARHHLAETELVRALEQARVLGYNG